jgi:N-acetylglucosamine kinase-like BadF-type ATPase
MKKFLPILFLFLSLSFLLPQKAAFAQTPTPVQQLQQNNQVPSGSWVIDPEVTFIGKNAARSGNLLDFILRNYNWVCVKQVSPTQCDNSNNPLASVWLTTVTFIVVPLLFVIIIATAIIIIVSRGRSLTIMRFLPRFIAVILLIFFSFPLLQFFYQFIDVIQGFFLRSKLAPCPPDCISQKDLLYVGWDYRSFIGLRLLGDQYSESAFISLLLTKLTALTYYVMVGILVLRKIILWLFIIVSPIFPLLLLYYPIRNTGKIWVGEFFRWLLYAPLFAIFLKGLVSLWRNQIPLVFSNPDIGNASAIVYPTAVNILLGGPKQYVTPTNSVNLTETFALYVVSLLMLWGVIILPWILLQIFLDYASNIGVGDSAVMKTLVNKISSIQGPPGSPHSPATGGSALSLPFAKKFNVPIAPTGTTGMAREIPRGVTESRSVQNNYMPTAQVKAQVLNLANVPLPTMRDIAKYDTSLLSKDKDRQKETTIIRDNLLKIGNPSSSTSESEKEHFTEIREKLVSESKSGNVLATNILNAANIANKRSMQASTNQIKSVLTQIANPSSATTSHAATTINKEKVAQMNQSLVKAKSQGNALAASILSVNDKTSTMEIEKLQERIMDAKLKGEPIAGQVAELTARQKASLPTVNRVQTVSKEDYEAVKQMWKENYKNLEVPEGMVGTRTEWIKADMVKIEEIINSLSSKDEEQVTKGMQEVSSILPFLLVGGFSQAEILSYLKAKLDAAKDVAAEIVQEEDDKVTINVRKTATATQTLSASLPDAIDDGEDINDSGLTNLSSKSTQQQDAILGMLNIKIPKISDIARYEAISLSKDRSRSTEIDSAHEMLRNIANPGLIVNQAEKERFAKLREKLVEESQKGNLIAQAVLSAADGKMATGEVVSSDEAKSMLSQIANPSLTVKPADKERFARLNEQLTKASKEGNALASTLLSVKETASLNDIEKLTTQLTEEKLKGDTLAESILSNIQQSSTLPALPASNRIQTVSQEDYQAVKSLWKENYQNLELSEGMASTRSEWIKNDISKIDNIVNLLTSTDQQQISQGMQEVSSILPFLLIGGFSQGEIIAYLKAKRDAAKETSAEINHEEDISVSIAKKQIQTPQNDKFISEEIADDSTGQSVNQQNYSVANQVSDEMFKISNLQLPKLSDIVSYEVRHLTKDKTESERIDKIQQVLERISKPEKITSAQEREQYEKLKERLLQERESGNQTAGIILSAVSQLSRAASDIDLTLSEIKVVLTQIVNPQSVASSDDRDYYTRLHEYLEKESKEKNNQLAAKILKVNESTRTEELQDIKEQLAVRSQDNNLMLPQVTVAMNDIAKARQLKTVVRKIMTLSDESGQDNETITSLRETLKSESAKGNSVASSVLSLNAKSTDAEFRSVHENLTAAGEAGNSVASSVLALYSASGTGAIEEKDISIEDTKTMLKLISNPQAATTDADRNYYSELQGYVKAENAGSNNVLAQKILTVNDATGVQDVQEIKNHLFTSAQAQTSVLPKVTQALSEYVQLRRLKEVTSKMSDTSITPSAVNDGKVTELKNLIVEEDKKGNSLATSLLSINDSTPDATLRQIHITLKEAVKKGDPLAKSVVSRISKQFDFTPANRLQKVTDEDYKEAFELWKKAYKQYFVPQGFTEDLKGRMDWINSDIADITETISLINSTDPDEKEKGMNKVSGILPFLLLGGFSFDEIQKYLKTKLDAANAALKELVENDENSVSVPVNNIGTKPKTMEASEEANENK